MELLWKVVGEIIDTRLRESVRLHDAPNIFCTGKGMGMNTAELKLEQELNIIDHDTLLLVLLDLQKAYNTVYRGRLLTTLEGYGARPHMCNLLAVFWD